jgi:hypothetical protein
MNSHEMIGDIQIRNHIKYLVRIWDDIMILEVRGTGYEDSTTVE